MWSIVLSIAFAIGLYLFMGPPIEASREAALKTVDAEMALHEKKGPSMLETAAAVAVPFVAHVGAGRFNEAYPAARGTLSERGSRPAAFEKACRESALLAGARSVTLNRLRQQNAGTAATVEAMGVLDFPRRRGVGSRLRFPAKERALPDPRCLAGGGAGACWA